MSLQVLVQVQVQGYNNTVPIHFCELLLLRDRDVAPLPTITFDFTDRIVFPTHLFVHKHLWGKYGKSPFNSVGTLMK